MNPQGRAFRAVRLHLAIAAILVASFVFAFILDAEEPRSPSRPPTIDALFSPGGGCESRIVEEIQRAEKLIHGQIHLFTSKAISDSLVAARKRGVDVQLVMDKSQEKMTYGRWPVMRRGGVQIYFDREHDVNNNKVLIIDLKTVITGSYNYTKAAEEKNAENIVIIEDDSSVAEKFESDFQRHLKHAVRAAN